MPRAVGSDHGAHMRDTANMPDNDPLVNMQFTHGLNAARAAFVLGLAQPVQERILSAWNPFRRQGNRADAHSHDMAEDREVWREFLSRGMNSDLAHIGLHTARLEAERSGRPFALVESASSVETIPTDWLWHRWIPTGALSIFEGFVKTGKSLFATDLIARLSRGAAMPYEDEPAEPAVSIYIGAEDSVSGSVQPRLAAAGADPDYVFYLSHILTKSGRSRYRITADGIKQLAERIRATRAKFVYFDAFMGLIDGIQAGDEMGFRRILEPLGHLADETKTAIVMCRHFGKGAEERSPQHRGLNSTALGAVARTTLQFGAISKSSTRGICLALTSWEPDSSARRYQITGKTVTIDGTNHQTAVLNWLDPIPNFNPRDLRPETGPSPETALVMGEFTGTKLCASENAILAALKSNGGEMEQKDLIKQARLSGSTYFDSRKRLIGKGILAEVPGSDPARIRLADGGSFLGA